MITLEEIWRGALPASSRLLAGAEHLRRQVSWVLVLKPRPPGLDAPQGGELILLSTHTLTALDSQLTLARALGPLAARATAVAVRGEVPPEAVREAERLRFPLFQLPASLALATLERDLLHFLSQRRGEWYRQKHEILNELAALAVQGQGLAAIARHVAQATGHACVFEDDRGEVLAWHLPADFPEECAAAVQAYLDGGEAPVEVMTGDGAGVAGNVERGLGRLSAPVTLKERVAGTVSLLGPVASLDGQGQLVLEAGATAGAIELAREHAVQETVHRIQGDLIADLLAGNGDQQTLERRARRLGYDLAAPQVAIAFCPVPDPRAPPRPRRDVLAVLSKRLNRVLATYEVRAPSHIDDELLTVFYAVDGESTPAALKRLAERLCHDLADVARHHQLFAGVSRAQTGMSGFRSGYEEASRALELGRALTPDRAITYFGDLGVYRLLFAMRGAREMQEFYDEMLGRLARYDAEKKTELIHTLDAYLCAANATESAARLNLHRNSLLYRLRRIREITGLDLDDPETKLALHLALRVGETLRTETALGA